MLRIILAVAVTLAAAFAVPSIASASSTVTLKMPREMQSQFPSVRSVKAANLPTKTYGYAPRWLVAETAVATDSMVKMSETGRIPKTVHPQGARWDGGKWRVSYRVVTVTEDGNDYSYGAFTVRKGSQVLTFNGYS
jgi:hypothetical protein